MYLKCCYSSHIDIGIYFQGPSVVLVVLAIKYIFSAGVDGRVLNLFIGI